MLLHRAIAAVTLLNVLRFPPSRWLLAHIFFVFFTMPCTAVRIVLCRRSV